uniref:DNA fragmentation factor 40 C-terminal domain-containing protein n=1 Tax=Amblyomma maculatum TaxID=34609 RepID=G3MSS0_AMBMU
MADSREEDPKWFEGEKRATSKRAVLRERAKTRIKGYYYKSKDEMQKRLGDRAANGCVRHLFEEFLQILKQRDHNGHYFVRGETDALCLSDGKFSCQGTFSRDLCSGRLHVINPYSSREQLVLFSTWNLDHRIERSRSILPTIVSAIQHANGRAINVDYFFRLLFTTENLKLVHPVCHIKSEHGGFSCDPRNWYADSAMQDDGRGDEAKMGPWKAEPVLSTSK